MDKLALGEMDQAMRLAQQEEQHFIQDCEEMEGFDDGDSKAGVPYLDWLMRSLHDGEKGKSTGS